MRRWGISAPPSDMVERFVQQPRPLPFDAERARHRHALGLSGVGTLLWLLVGMGVGWVLRGVW